jgi:predicted nucleic acid-binding protein
LIVVDTNVIAWLFVPGDRTSSAEYVNMPLVSADQKLKEQFGKRVRPLS